MEKGLPEALNRLANLVDKAQRAGGPVRQGNVEVSLKRPGEVGKCSWPDCKARVTKNIWRVADLANGNKVLVPGIVLHFFVADHHISYTDLSRTDQTVLIAIMGMGE